MLLHPVLLTTHRLRKPAGQDGDDERRDAEEEERRTPSPLRRHCRRDRYEQDPQQLTGLVDAHHLRALHLRVVVSDQRLRRGVVARVGRAEHHTRAEQAGVAPRRARPDHGEAPDRRAPADDAGAAQPIGEVAERHRAQHDHDDVARRQDAERAVGQAELLLEQREQRRNDELVGHVEGVDRGQQEQRPAGGADEPAGDLERRPGGLARRQRRCGVHLRQGRDRSRLDRHPLEYTELRGAD